MTIWHTLIWASIIALGLAAFGHVLRSSRSPFLIGLSCAFVAYVLVVLLGDVWPRALTDYNLLLLAGIVPLIEEVLRVTAMFVLTPRSEPPRVWLAFGLGYGLLESTLKLTDNISILPSSGDIAQSLTLLSIPLTVLALHILLSTLAFRLRSAGLAAPIVFLCLFALHAANNYSAFAIARESWLVGMIEVWLRIAVT